MIVPFKLQILLLTTANPTAHLLSYCSSAVTLILTTVDPTANNPIDLTPNLQRSWLLYKLSRKQVLAGGKILPYIHYINYSLFIVVTHLFAVFKITLFFSFGHLFVVQTLFELIRNLSLRSSSSRWWCVD